MEIKALRETDLYDKHFDVIEPESHTVVSINYAIRTMEDVLLASATPADVFLQIQIKINELKHRQNERQLQIRRRHLAPHEGAKAHKKAPDQDQACKVPHLRTLQDAPHPKHQQIHD